MQCLECNKDFKKKWKTNRFCCVTCANRNSVKDRITRQRTSCRKCGEIFDRQIWRLEKNGNNFCSNVCRKTFNNKIKKVCPCKKEFYVWKVRKDSARYCSLACKSIYSKTGRKRDKGNTVHDRRNALLKYGVACELCTWNKLVEAHHIDYNCNEHDIGNLCILCPNCHKLCDKKQKNNPHFIPEKILRERLNRWKNYN